VVDVGLRRPTLDDVFLTLTGHDTEAGDGDAAESDDRIDVREKEAVR
jgi:ABC-2 type transport system ATP-binding protein